MSQVRIKFRSTGCNAIFGNFSADDEARVSPELAKHFVEEVGCAEYLDGSPAPSGAASQAKPAAAKKGKRK
jgi:hypothetical protein